jgi:glycosyltransferase involved in cell wall biosynthesis
LPSILAQQYAGAWELLLVDDASTDETPAVLSSFMEQYPARLRVLRIAKKTFSGKKHALAQGIAAAKYDLLLLTDADCIPGSLHWVQQMVLVMMEKPETEIVLGYGPMRHPALSTPSAKETLLSFWARYETAFTAAQYFALAAAGMPYMGVGRNLCFKRQVFDRVGGFERHLQIPSGDDDLLVNAASNAKNTAICLDYESFMYSEAASNWSAWFKQKRRHLTAGTAYKWPHKVVLAALALSQIGHYAGFLILILVGIEPKIVIGLFLLRQVSIMVILGKILRILRESGLFFKIPVFDAFLTLYFGVVVPWFLYRSKNVEWGQRVDS